MLMRQAPPWLTVPGLALGVVLWSCGLFNAFGELSPLSNIVFIAGVAITVLSAFVLLRSSADHDLPNSQLAPIGARYFCLAFGFGLSVLGLALSASYPTVMRLTLGLAGVALMAWSPRALRRFRVGR